MFFVFLITVGILVWARSRQTRVWRSVAAEHRLQAEGGLFSSMRIHGVSATRTIEIRQSNNRNRRGHAQCTVTFLPVPVRFVIRPESRLSLMRARGGLFGQLIGGLTGRDVEVGDVDFDTAARIDGNADVLRGFLTPRHKAIVLDLFERYTNAVITERSVEFLAFRVQNDAERLSHVIDSLLGAALVFESTARSTTQAPPAPRPAPADPFAQTPVVAASPSNPAPRPAEPGPAPQRAESPRDTDDQSPDAHDASVMAADLFSGTTNSITAQRRFDRLYRGVRIRWTGTVLRTRPHRVEVVVGEVEDPLFGRSSVVAVVPTEVTPPVGVEVAVEGTAGGIDYLQRSIIIEDGSIRPA